MSKSKFQAGDRVRCVEDAMDPAGGVAGEEYTVFGVHPEYASIFLREQDVGGTGWADHRFELVAG